MSHKAPRGVRLVIAIVGRRNAGKSSLINSLAGQEISIVSDQPGTTTDPVGKHYELLPFGPVTFFDTAGLDDEGCLGEKRIQAARKILWRSDLALVVVGEKGFTIYEQEIIDRIKKLRIPYIVVFNKSDISAPTHEDVENCSSSGSPHISVSSLTGDNVHALKELLLAIIPEEMKQEPVLAADIVNAGDVVVCVTPIDLSAPKGRLILPQVQILREILDCNAIGVVAKETELGTALSNLKRKPSLVITDSQVVLEVAEIVPKDMPLTTFSTLFARYKGDLEELVGGSNAIDDLKDGDTVLIGEACSHHPLEDDIGRVKIPRWISEYTGKDLDFEVYAGHDFPENLEQYKMAIHCGGCMINRMEMLRRIRECGRRGVPVTNYGVAISKVQGLLERVIAPFPGLNA